MPASDHAAEVAAALERVAEWKRGVRCGSTSTGELVDTLARLLRESQPEPAAPAVGDDEALLAAAERFADDDERGCVLMGKVAARLRTALADVARLEEEQAKEAREWNDLRDRYDATVLELTQARAALAAAVQEKEKAVAEEREDRLNVERSRARFFKERDEARAALYAAVAEETQACAQLCRDEADTSLVVDDEDRGYREGLLWAEANIRARAGRNDV